MVGGYASSTIRTRTTKKHIHTRADFRAIQRISTQSECGYQKSILWSVEWLQSHSRGMTKRQRTLGLFGRFRGCLSLPYPPGFACQTTVHSQECSAFVLAIRLYPLP